MSDYLENIISCLRKIEEEEASTMQAASEKVADVICSDGLIFTFGCGHSHLPGLDAFYRAGGLANVSCMLDTDLMLHNGAAKSSRIEKMEGIGTEIFRRYVPTTKDLLIVISASGKNAVPCEVAQCAVQKGVFTIGISSSCYYGKGEKLHTIVDLPIDCKVPYGDACVPVGDAAMGGLSTAASCFILNNILIGGAKLALQRGVKPPVYLSGNIEGGKEHNIALENLYLNRVKHL